MQTTVTIPECQGLWYRHTYTYETHGSYTEVYSTGHECADMCVCVYLGIQKERLGRCPPPCVLGVNN